MAFFQFHMKSSISKKLVNLAIVSMMVFSLMMIAIPGSVVGDSTRAGPTYVPGTISSPVQWTEANSPYIIADNLTVTPTGVIHIDPGVSVLVDDFVNIFIEGKIYSNGTALKPITFSANVTIPWTYDWNNMYIKSSGNSFQYTNLFNSSTPLYFQGTSGTPLVNNIVESVTIDNSWSESLIMDYGNNNYFGNTSFGGSGEAYYGLWLKNSNNNRFYNSAVGWTYDDNIHLENSSYNTFDTGSALNSDSANYGGITLLMNSQFNTFINFNVTDTSSQLIYVGDSGNNTFIGMELNGQTLTDAVKVTNSRDIMIKDSVFKTDTQKETLGMYSNSHVTFQNNVFYNGTINYYDTQSRFNVQYRLVVKAIDKGTSQPIQNADVLVKDAFGTTVGTYKTNSAGLTPSMITNDYQGRDNGLNNKDTDAGERIIYTPHNITITEPTYLTAYADPEPRINMTKQVTVAVEPIAIDYIKIMDGTGGSGNQVTGKSYEAGSNLTFYAGGYNDQIGYIKDIDVSWSSNNTNIATVTPDGTSTTFVASVRNSGNVKITATDGGVLTDTADITVDPAVVDYIRVQDADSPTGNWIGDRNYLLADMDMFYSGAYNNTLGYLGPVSSSWTSANANVATVDASGSMVMFTAAANNFGDTYVEATYGLLKNRTGTLTVLPPPIDGIIIMTMPDGNGIEVGDISYKEGDEDTYYAAGFNVAFGYVFDVDALWTSSSTGVGTVTTPGTSTTFKAASKGTTKVTAEYSGLSDTTGTITVTGKGDVDLLVNIRTVPASPILYMTEIVIIVTVENLGSDPVNDVIVHFMVNDILESIDTITFLGPSESEELMYPNSSADTGIYELVAIADPNGAITETDETNNRANMTVDILSLEDWTKGVEIEPATVTLTAGNTITFTAMGIGLDEIKYNITPSWTTNGGGIIDASGKYTATTSGVWEVYAAIGPAKGTAKVTVIAGEPRSIKVVPENAVVKIGDTRQFTALGIDSYNNEKALDQADVEWYMNGTVGTIGPNGTFTATTEGIGYVGANIIVDDIKLNDEAEVAVKAVIVNEKKFEERAGSTEYKLIVGFVGDGNVTLQNLNEDDLTGENIGDDTYGEKFDHIGVFVKIEIPDDEEWAWLYIEVSYDPSQLPRGFDESQLELYYFEVSSGTWVKAENSGVDTIRHVVYANVTHLTIFAPMAEASAAPDDSEESDGAGLDSTLMMALALAAVVFIIAILAGMIVIRKRKVPLEGKPEDERDEELQDEEMREDELKEKEMIDWGVEDDDEFDLTLLEPITTKCPKCKAVISMEPATDDKIHLECGECGKKGRMPNPYLPQIDRIQKEENEKRIEEKRKEEKRKRVREGERKRVRERDAKEDLIEIPCKECGEAIAVPYSDSDAKVSVKCESCGAKGKIKNPYLDKKEPLPDKRKPPKRKRPGEVREKDIEEQKDEEPEFEERKEFDISEFDDIDDDIDF